MTQEQPNPQAPNFDPNTPVEIDFRQEIVRFRQNPTMNVEDLFSSNKMENSEYPDRPGVRVKIDKPIATSISADTNVMQHLDAVLGVSEQVAIGIVTAEYNPADAFLAGAKPDNTKVRYVSLFNNDPSKNNGRARILGPLTAGVPLTIGRGMLESLTEEKGTVPGVSGTHCTIEIDDDNVLTIIDEHSTNGTTVFTNGSNQPRNDKSLNVQTWSQPSAESVKLLEAEKEAAKLRKVSKLGRFTVDKD
jgi:hypothetical protein